MSGNASITTPQVHPYVEWWAGGGQPGAEPVSYVEQLSRELESLRVSLMTETAAGHGPYARQDPEKLARKLASKMWDRLGEVGPGWLRGALMALVAEALEMDARTLAQAAKTQ